MRVEGKCGENEGKRRRITWRGVNVEEGKENERKQRDSMQCVMSIVLIFLSTFVYNRYRDGLLVCGFDTLQNNKQNPFT